MPRISRALAVVIVAAGAMVALAGFDLWREPEPLGFFEVFLDVAEKALIVGAMVAIALAFRRVDRLGAGQEALRDYLERAMAQGAEWRDARAGEIGALGEAIAQEFRHWGLSPAEIDIAGLILKGASMKEIAIARDTAEATIRQQAQQVYRKAGLSGRIELQAYFLDSLFPAPRIGERCCGR